MSVAEKLQIIANNQQLIYDKGYTDGLANSGPSMPPGPIVSKTYTSPGPFAYLLDISENEHTITVQLRSDEINDFSSTEILMKGKNLLNAASFEVGQQLYGSVGGKLSLKASSSHAYRAIKIAPSTIYTISRIKDTQYRIFRLLTVDDNGVILTDQQSGAINSGAQAEAERPYHFFVTHPDAATLYIDIQNTTGDAVLNDIEEISLQLENNSIATSYEPYFAERIISSADGNNTFISKGQIANFAVAEKTMFMDITYNQSYGMKCAYDQLWDALQQKGQREDYSNYTFNKYWNQITFKPKYNIIPTGSASTAFSGIRVGNFKQIIDEQGIIFDTSKATRLDYLFRDTTATYLPTIDASNATTLQMAFYYCQNLHTIEKLIVPETLTNYSSAFTYAGDLVTINIEGIIAGNISFQSSKKLSRSSIESIIQALSNTSTGLSATFSKTAVNAAYGVTDPASSPEWTALIGEKPNWNFIFST